MAERGEVDGNTIVFDLTVQHLGDVRDGGWERAAVSSWHAQLLPSGSSDRRTPGPTRRLPAARYHSRGGWNPRRVSNGRPLLRLPALSTPHSLAQADEPVAFVPRKEGRR